MTASTTSCPDKQPTTAFERTHAFRTQKTRPAWRVSFPSAPDWEGKLSFLFIFGNSATWKVETLGLFLPPLPPQNIPVFCSTVRWAAAGRRGVCNISGLTTPPLLPWKPECSISPLSRSCSSLARCWAYMMCHGWEGRSSHFGFDNFHGNWGNGAWHLPARGTEGVCTVFLTHTHTHTPTHGPIHKLPKSALWRILQVWPGKDIHNTQKLYN